MRKIFQPFLAIMFMAPVFAQEGAPQQVENVFRVTFLTPGVSYEQKTGLRTTLYAHASIRPYGSFSYSDAFGTNINFGLDPSVAVQYRIYYNYKKRTERGLRTERNSMNYLAPVIESYYSKTVIGDNTVSELNRRGVNSFGVVWGLQRNLPKRFSLDFNAGLGYRFTKGTKLDEFGHLQRVNISQPVFLGGLTLGLWLNKA